MGGLGGRGTLLENKENFVPCFLSSGTVHLNYLYEPVEYGRPFVLTRDT